MSDDANVERAEVEVIFDAFSRQREFIEALLSGKYRYLVFGGAIRGGKSYLLVALTLLFCRVWPGSRWAIVRKDLPTLKRNVLPVFEKLRPPNFCDPVNKSDWTARCKNGSLIIFHTESRKDDPDLDRWKGLEVNGFLFEEINECLEKTFHKGIERAGSYIIPRIGKDKQPPPMVLGSCNPTKNWVKRVFYDPWEKGKLEPPFFYMPSRIFDNPHLPEEYKESLKNLPEQEYNRFVLGDWSVADEPDQLILSQWVEDAINREPLDTREAVARLLELGPDVPGLVLRALGLPWDLHKRGWKAERVLEKFSHPPRMGVDVARFGSDSSALCVAGADNLPFDVQDLETFEKFRGTKIARAAMQRATHWGVNAEEVRVDTVGLGSGVADIMHGDGWDVLDYIGGAAAVSKDWSPETKGFLSFKNLRSESWWLTREIFRLGLASIDPDLPQPILTALRQDLTAPAYNVSGDKVVSIEPKDKIKARLGRSPDHGDALVMAWALMPKKRKLIIV